MTYVPRSPRRTTKLRAVVDDGAGRSVGRVRDMSTSGLFVDTSGCTDGNTALALGRRVAVVPLIGDLDGERLPAEVARVGDKGVALRFLGLDAEHRQRLRAIMNGDDNPLVQAMRPSPSTQPHALPEIPSDAPVVLLTDEAPASSAVAAAEGATDTFEVFELRGHIEELEGQLLEIIRDKTLLLDENNRLKRQVVALTARNSLLLRAQDELLTSQERVLEIERAPPRVGSVRGLGPRQSPRPRRRDLTSKQAPQ
jgi:hypothetical protein